MDLDDLAGDRRIDLRHGLHRLDRAGLVAVFERVTDFRQLDEDHLTELALGEVGDPDGADVVFEVDPLVLLGVGGIRQGCRLRTYQILSISGFGLKGLRPGLAGHR